MKYFLYTCILLFLSIISTAQILNKDSIVQELEKFKHSPADTVTIRLFREWGYDLIEEDSTLSKAILEEALAKSLRINDVDAITNSYRLLGLWYQNFNHYQQALQLYRASLDVASRNHNLYLMAGAYLNIGNIKYWKGEYDSCIDYYLKTTQLFEDPAIYSEKDLTVKILDKKRSDLYANISAAFNTLHNLKKADEYINKSIFIAQKYNSQAAANALAYYMQQKADNYSSNGQAETALRIRLQHLPTFEQGNLKKSLLMSAYQSIANEYFELGKLDSSKIFAKKSLEISNQLKNREGIAAAYLKLGTIALQEKNYALAKNYLNACKNYFTTIEDPEEKKHFYNAMRQLLFKTGKYKEAYLYYEIFNALNDSILNSERSKQFAEREARFQSEQKDTQIQLQKAALSKKSLLNYILIGIALAIVSIFVLGYRNYQQKEKLQQQRINELETQQQLSATEAILKGEEQERSRLAKDLHDGLGGMLSGIKYTMSHMKQNLIMTPENQLAFERSLDMLDSSINEMRRVAHNMMPEALLKFGLDTALQDFCQQTNETGAIQLKYQSIGIKDIPFNQTISIHIYRIVQELINNILKHAEARQAIVQISNNSPAIHITVEDDGKGLPENKAPFPKGMGWNNIYSRVEYLKGKVDIQTAPGKGTSVHIELIV